MKKLQSKLKKGFTIVELVIVIAVIAILAAVLIPTLSNVINSAETSADTQTVKNLNTILSANQTVNNAKASTMQEVIEQAEEGGYKIEKLTPTSDGDILWEQTTNRFYLVNSSGEIIFSDETVESPSLGYTYWKITSSATEAESGVYSYYLADGFDSKSISVSTGIDVGTNEGISITYTATDTQNVIFNTNGGDLTINNEKATVKHYGTSDNVTVTAVDKASYYPYGIINVLTFVKGHLYVQSTATIGTLSIEPTDTAVAGDVVIDCSTEATVDDVLLVVSSGATTVTNIAVTFNSQTLANKAVSSIDGDTETSLSEIGCSFFDGGYGTESSPFLISTYTHLYNMSKLSSTQYYFKQTADIEVTSTDLFSKLVSFNGVYDGNYHCISLKADLEDLNTVVLFKVTKSATIKNLNTKSATNCLMSVAQFSAVFTGYYLCLDNVNAYGPDDGGFVYAESSNISPFISQHYYTKTSLTGTSRVDLILNNCTNYVNLSNTGTCTGVFSGGDFYRYYVYEDDSCEMYYTVTNCTNEGNIYGGSQAGLLIGNGASGMKADVSKGKTIQWISQYISVTNVKNNGIIAAAGNMAGIFSIYEDMNALYTVGGTGKFMQSVNELDGKSFNVYVNNNGTFSVLGDTASSYTYKLAITLPYVYTNHYYDENGDVISRGALMGRTLNIDLSVISATTETAGSILVTNLSHKAYVYSDAVNDGVISVDTNLSYNYLFENSYYVALYVSSNGTLYIIFEDSEDEFPYVDTDNNSITSFNIYAYYKDGLLAGSTKYKNEVTTTTDSD